MRAPVVVGALAGLLVVLVAGGLVAAMLLGAGGPETARPGVSTSVGPGGGVVEPSASGSPRSASPAPTATPAGSASNGTSPASASAGSGEPVSTPIPSPGLRVGDLAPPLVLEGLSFSDIDLAQLRGGPVWVNFMASWCPPCRDELPLMGRIQRHFQDELTIVLVDVEEQPDVVAAFLDSLGATFPTALDLDGAVAQEWGALVLPVHYWIDAEGRITAVTYGGGGPELLIEGLRSVIPGAQLETPAPS